MAKVKSVYVCTQCGHEEPKWAGRCPDCGEWNTFSEVTAAAKSGTSTVRKTGTASVPLSSISGERGDRLSTKIDEMDRVLGGGLVRGSSVLIGGEPGIGKSTLMLQAAARTEAAGRTLYVTGEESAVQL